MGPGDSSPVILEHDEWNFSSNVTRREWGQNVFTTKLRDDEVLRRLNITEQGSRRVTHCLWRKEEVNGAVVERDCISPNEVSNLTFFSRRDSTHLYSVLEIGRTKETSFTSLTIIPPQFLVDLSLETQGDDANPSQPRDGGVGEKEVPEVDGKEMYS